MIIQNKWLYLNDPAVEYQILLTTYKCLCGDPLAPVQLPEPGDNPEALDLIAKTLC